MLTVEKNTYYKLILILTWFSFFFSINLNPEEFVSYNLINKTRLVFPLFCIFLLIYWKYKEIKFVNFINLPSFLFCSIFFLYIFFNLITPNNNNINIFWPLYMLLSFLTLHIFTNFDEKKHLLIFTSIIVFFSFLFFFIFAIIKMYQYDNIHFYGVYGASLTYGGFESPPRSSGLSRLSLIMFVLITFYYLINKKKSFGLLLFISTLALITLLFQSRTTSFIYIFICGFIIIFYFKKIFYDKRLIIFIIILPLFFNSCYQYLLVKNRIVDGDPSISGLVKNSLLRNTMSFQKKYSDIEYYLLTDEEKKISKFSSDRFLNWKKALIITKNDYFRGYGAQADRLLLKQSIHNGLLYSILSGGILAGVAHLLINIYSIFLLIKFYFFTNYKLKDDILVHFSASVIIILGLRSILETSFAVFSIDYLIFIISLLYFNSHLKKYQ